MKITIEVGNDEQKKQIEKEIKIIESSSNSFQPKLNITHVIVPIDFDKTINRLQKTNSYTAQRKHQTIAKILELEDGITIVLSPILYTEKWDDQMRLYIFVHEIVHVYSKHIFPKAPDHIANSPSALAYFVNMYLLFDEYIANRKAFEFIDSYFQKRSSYYDSYIHHCVEGHIKTLIDESVYYDKLKKIIASFRQRLFDNESFWRNIQEHYEGAAKDIVYAYSYIDHYPEFKNKESILKESRFVNDKTLELIKFFKMKHEAGDPNLIDGIPVYEKFLSNFGMRFEDRPEGLYCHVLDI